MVAAFKLRTAVVESLLKNEEKPDVALARLKTSGRAIGREKLDGEVDYAEAAIDIGRRLVSAGKYELSREFFQGAEKTLAGLVRQTKDDAAEEKAGYLEALATLRCDYLDDPAQGKKDIETAMSLRPADERLVRRRNLLGSRHGKIFGPAVQIKSDEKLRPEETMPRSEHVPVLTPVTVQPGGDPQTPLMPPPGLLPQPSSQEGGER